MSKRMQKADYGTQTIKSNFLLFTFYLLLGLSGCAGCPYSFTGASVPPHLKTIVIPIVEDQSGYGDPTLRNEFSRQLLSRFVNDNTLQTTDRGSADSMLEGVITNVKDAPNVVQGGDQVAERRITVTVRMTFQDLKLRKKVWEKEFSNWGNYASGAGATKRDDGIKEAIRKITEDILNETVAGW
ncbi:MAG: LptE family protein [Ignavibacteriales bacterium]|nr:LptE family protein [Ignavibacteriales bacterium]